MRKCEMIVRCLTIPPRFFFFFFSIFQVSDDVFLSVSCRGLCPMVHRLCRRYQQVNMKNRYLAVFENFNVFGPLKRHFKDRGIFIGIIKTNKLS